jgi:hypothetical protein
MRSTSPYLRVAIRMHTHSVRSVDIMWLVAVVPEIGNNAAAAVAMQLLHDFPSIRFGLLLGIGGGPPGGGEEEKNDVPFRRCGSKQADGRVWWRRSILPDQKNW